jgi:hypothetical protein
VLRTYDKDIKRAEVLVGVSHIATDNRLALIKKDMADRDVSMDGDCGMVPVKCSTAH